MGDNRSSHSLGGRRATILVGLAVVAAFALGIWVGPRVRGDAPAPPADVDAGVRLALDGGVDLLPDASLHIDLPAPPQP